MLIANGVSMDLCIRMVMDVPIPVSMLRHPLIVSISQVMHMTAVGQAMGDGVTAG